VPLAWARRSTGEAAQADALPYSQRVVRLLRARAAPFAVFFVILVLFDVVRSWSVHVESPMIAMAIPLWVMGTAPLVPVLVEATGLRGAALAAAMAAATIAALGIVAFAISAMHTSPLTGGVSAGKILSNEAFLYRGWWLYSAAALLFAAYCRTREREQEVLRAAREAELARADTQRDIVASRLKVLQARVEPSLLFDALADVRAAYLANPPAADALLDDLVTYLRAALPQMRGGASTLGREVALADAYLHVVPAGRNKQLVTQTNVDIDIEDADFPPMVLLPVVHAAADAGAAHIAIEAKQGNGRIAIAVRAASAAIPPGWSDDALDVVRETLSQYLGNDASLAVTDERAGATVTVTWPTAKLQRVTERVA
jgi:hypothetical protein